MRSVIVLTLVAVVAGHLSIWHPSTFDKDRAAWPNSDWNSQPLADLPFKEWWWHANLDYPPPADKVFILPANGAADVEISSNKGQTSMGTGLLPNPRDPPSPWDYRWGNLHAPHREDVAGCALGIAYKSNQYDVKPNDFVIFSVVHDCPARQLQSFQIPNLPACPNHKCMCSWFWIHKSIGGSDQMYMTPFACNVTNVRGDAKPIDVQNAQPPRRCDNGQPCVNGPKHPMYWMNKEGNNMPEKGNTMSAPIYNSNYGYNEGAQNDIFVSGNNGGNSRFGPIENGDRYGNDLPNGLIKTGSVEECQRQCDSRDGCNSFSYDNCGNQWCWLKSGNPSVDTKQGCRLTGTINK